MHPRSANISKRCTESETDIQIRSRGMGLWGGSGLVKTGPTRWDRHSESWVFMREVAADDPDNADEASVAARIRELLRLPEIELKIHKIGRWDVEGVVARRYREGRVLQAGDAAHRHPPVSALGLTPRHNARKNAVRVRSAHRARSRCTIQLCESPPAL